MTYMNRAYFYQRVREGLFGGRLAQKQVDGMNRLLDVWFDQYAHHDYRWLAYALATVKWETAHTMLPVREIGKGKGRKYGVPTGPYKQVYYGRGDVQLTWERNYAVMSKIVGEDLVKNPDKALDPKVSAQILFEGMIRGTFTGKKLSDYIMDDKCDFVGARRIVNGTDKAALIAGLANIFAEAIYQAMQEPENAEDMVVGDQTTGKGAGESKTILTQLWAMASTLGVGAFSFLEKMPQQTLITILVFVVVMSALYTVRERWLHSKEDGV
jgi:putative chitinase